MTYMTDERIKIATALPSNTPYAIQGVSSGYFSIARYYGGITFNGSNYTYIADSDELIRDDVLKAIAKAERKRTK